MSTSYCMEEKDKKLALWKEAVPRMNEEDLEFLLDFSECFDPKLIKMAKTRYKKITEPSEDEDVHEVVEETIKDAVLRILGELNCHYDIDDDGDIVFQFQDEEFFITADDEGPFIDIWEYNWMQVSLNDIDRVSQLRGAINEVNFDGSISTTFFVSEDKHEIQVNCGTNILFGPYVPNRKGYLEYILKRFFDTHHLLETRMLKQYEKEHLSEIYS